MLDRHAVGDMPAKHHIKLEDGKGGLRYEHCLTRDGFEGPYTILYHERRPHLQRVADLPGGWAQPDPDEVGPRPLARRHYQSQQLGKQEASPLDARIVLLHHEDVSLSVLCPDREDTRYFVNGDADDLFFIHEGTGLLRTSMGDLRYEPLDYVFVPKGVHYRFAPDEGVDQRWLAMECFGGMSLLKQWRNEAGQLRMDAPYCHRDFRRPDFDGPRDEGIREFLVKRDGVFHGFVQEHNPLDVVGWDGTVYPWVFPMLNFQPRAGLVHLPPTWHGTFACRGGLICSFVPRMVDFHPEAIPCPYPHSSVDVDEFLYYVRGNFTSRKGVGPGSISHHPAGIPHGPHPGSYEASIGHDRTDEMAVMLDTYKVFKPTKAALGIEHDGYHDTFIE